MPPGVVRLKVWEVGGKIIGRLSDVNTRATSKGQDELIGKFKVVM